jgi:hypothetical protein
MTANSFADIERDLIDLRRRVDGGNGVMARLNRAEEFLIQAREVLARFSDSSAERALQLISSALDDSRQASCGSLRSFISASVELQLRIRD